MDIARDFMRIFSGNENAHGEYRIEGKKGLKIAGKGTTVKVPASEELWEKHLNGEIHLGIIPIKSNSSCNWGAVDIDSYDGLDLETLSMTLPNEVILCRSKSGGAHLFLFTQSFVSASLIRKKLTIIARAVGHPEAEIFPKQERINPGELGNWLNMPYFDASSTMRYCIKGGVVLSAEEFVSLVGESAMTSQELVGFSMNSIKDVDEGSEFADAPPCLHYLTKNGFPGGSRNIALFSMGVYARMKFATGWEDRIFEYNQRFMGPGTYSEVAGIIRSLMKRTYYYKCKEQPLLSHCDKETCAKRQYGVQTSNDEERARRPCILDDVERPVKCYAPAANSKDDPYWVFNINGVGIDVTIDMVRSQNFFAREYLRQYHKVILPIKDAKWVKEMNDILAEAELHQLAPDAGPEGQLWIHIEDFCTNKSVARAKEELLIGKPWKDTGRIYFRSSDLMKYLDQQRYRAMKEKEVWVSLKRNGAKHHDFTLKGKHVSCWSISQFTEQEEGFTHEKMDMTEEL